MKSLLIVDRYMPHNGGSRRYYHELAKQLPDVAVLTGHQPGEVEFDEKSGVRTIRRPGIRPNYASPADKLTNPILNMLFAYLPGMISTIFWTWWEVVRNRPKMIHAGGYVFAGLAAMIVAPMFRIPYVVFAHGEDVSSSIPRRFFSKFMCAVFSRAEVVVANCLNTAGLVRSCGPDLKRIVVANPGVDNKWFTNGHVVFKEGFKNGSAPCLLSVGRMVPHKGHATVIKTLPKLLIIWPDLRWIMVGTGPEMETLENLVKSMGLQRNVIFLSGLSDRELRKCFDDSDLFVQPNGEANGICEGYGMVFIEAGASGLAVVGGRNGGVPEAVLHGKTGMLVPPFDQDVLAEVLTALLENHKLRTVLGKNGKRLAEARTWDKTLAPVVDLETGLLDQSA